MPSAKHRAHTPTNGHTGHRKWADSTGLSSATSADGADFGVLESSSSTSSNMATGRKMNTPKARGHQLGTESSVALDFLQIQKHSGRSRKRNVSGRNSASGGRRGSRSSSSSSSSSEFGAASSSESSKVKRHRQHRGGPSSPLDNIAGRQESVKQAYFSPTRRGQPHYNVRSFPDSLPPAPPASPAYPASPQRSTSDSSESEWDIPRLPKDAFVYILPEPCYDDEADSEARRQPMSASVSPTRKAVSPVHNATSTVSSGTSRSTKYEQKPAERLVEILPEYATLEEIDGRGMAGISTRSPSPEAMGITRRYSEADEDYERSSDAEDETIPAEFTTMARHLGIPDVSVADLFKKEGLVVEKAFTVLKYRRDVIEEFRCQLKCSREQPVLGLKVLDRTKKPYRSLLMPDVKVRITMEPTALDCFVNYKWPRGDAQMLEFKHAPMVMAFMRNMREPLLLVGQDETEQQKIHDCLTVVQSVAVKRAEEWQALGPQSKGAQYPPDLPLPKVMLNDRKARKYVDLESFHRDRHEFLESLSRISRTLKVEHAVKEYMTAAANNDLIGWVCHWIPSKSKYQRQKFNIWIYHNQPFMMVTDRKGRSVAGKLNLHTISSGRAGLENNMGYPSDIREKYRSPHVCHGDMLDFPGKQMFFTFETVEKMKDFQQVCAALGYLQSFGVTNPNNLHQ